MSEDFKIWWHREGSGMPPLKGEDTCEHVERVSAIAWSNGAYKATEALEAENARLKAEIEMMKASSRGHSTSHLYQRMAEENARLKAEVERLTKASQGAVKYVDHTMALTRQSMEHHKQVSRLEAQVERLTKAGNAMAEEISVFYREKFLYPSDSYSINAWNAAKEGKPRA